MVPNRFLNADWSRGQLVRTLSWGHVRHQVSTCCPISHWIMLIPQDTISLFIHINYLICTTINPAPLFLLLPAKESHSILISRIIINTILTHPHQHMSYTCTQSCLTPEHSPIWPYILPIYPLIIIMPSPLTDSLLPIYIIIAATSYIRSYI